MEFAIALIVIIVVLGALVARVFVRRVVAFEHERGVLYAGGRFRRVLEPGSHWLPGAAITVRKLDVRPRFATLSGQELLTADNVVLRMTVAAKYLVADPHVVVLSSDDYQQALYLELQMALREIVCALNVDDLLKQRAEISTRLVDIVAPKAQALGLTLQSAGIRDIMFPGELKKVFAEVVRAQKEGAASLEKARGETAALRNLANAARMIEGNPALLQLRLLQAIGERSGNTVVLGLPAQSTPVPISKAPTQNPPAVGDDPTD